MPVGLSIKFQLIIPNEFFCNLIRFKTSNL